MKNIKIKTVRFLILSIFLFFMAIMLSQSVYSDHVTEKKVLILHSYNHGYIWTDSIQKGIESVFEKNHILMDIKYMDTKKINDQKYFEELYQVYKYTLKHEKYDAIVSADNNALNFLLKYRDELFPNTPVVFCGVNGFNSTMIDGEKLITGVTEDVDVKGTIAAAVKLQPNMQKMIVVSDNKPSHEEFEEKVKDLIPLYKNIEFQLLDNIPISQVQEKVKGLSLDSSLLVIGDFIDDYGKFINIEDGIQILAKNFDIPIYSLWNQLLDHGIVGGKLTCGFNQGKFAAELALRVLSGENIETIPIETESPNAYMFDYNEIKSFDFKISKLPIGSIVINKPSDNLSISRVNLKFGLFIIIAILVINNIILHINVSRRKKAESSLRENEERLQTLINAGPDIMIFKDAQGRYLKINEACLKGFNFEGIDYIGKTDVEIGEINATYKQTFLNCKESDDYAWEKGEMVRGEEISPQNDGSYKVYDIIKVPIFYDNGERKGLVILGRDITELKKVGEKLVQSEERYRLLVESSPDGICTHINGKVTFVNPALAKLMGAQSSEEFIGKSVFEFIHKDYHEKVREHAQFMKNGNSPRIIEEKLITSDGKIIEVEVCDTYYEIEGKLAILSIVRDISERKRTEELQKRIKEEERRLKEAIEYERVRNEFFGNLSHEFKTPLNLIFSSVQLLKIKLQNVINGNEGEKISQYLKILNQNGFRLLRLINNLIDITKIDANYFQIDLQNCNIVSTVEDITLSVAQYIENKNIQIIFDTDVEEKIMACDPDKIERIILNLISNSIKFTKSGGKITVNIFDKGDTVIMSIKDTGIGIPENKIDVIFNRFGQVDKSTTRNHEGSGIGLSLVKSLVEMHEGSIEVESEYGKGTEFVIKLPVKVLDEVNIKDIEHNNTHDYVERINIEFSDIYE
ncbi:MASE3 domain-containing sensor histidine kinase [Oceanirhabdus sp. W0125-5]|uniref:MASE3 domain-containing sensor histidine kinase n=1 Tax=Oceanirhabdus sp. W0125-5 TaxID=2999116 RepID=UPI0022F2C058|nr:ABC transporter substrate binding protein [Oceanirhabdus sp. W0125-5]WBW97261.1 ABC transporter substrate binding protein [Oceanirhabdus sp. W0125-5]